MRQQRNQRRLLNEGWSILVVALISVSVLSGCGDPAPVKLGGEPTDAVEVLNDALKEWQAGKKVEDLKEDADLPVIVRDPDWEAGAKLKSFEIKKEAIPDGGNWRVDAVLTMEGKGVSAAPTVFAYSVTVEPKIISILRKDNLE